MLRTGTCKVGLAACPSGQCDIEVEGNQFAPMKIRSDGMVENLHAVVSPSGGFSTAEETIAAVNCMMSAGRARGSVKFNGWPILQSEFKRRPDGARLELVLSWQPSANLPNEGPSPLFEFSAGLRLIDDRPTDADTCPSDPVERMNQILWAFKDAWEDHENDPEWAAKRGPKNPD